MNGPILERESRYGGATMTALRMAIKRYFKAKLWEILLMPDEEKSLIPTDPSRQFEKMNEFDSVSRKLLDSELENRQLRSLMSRMCHWIVDTRAQEQGFLKEAALLLGVTPDEIVHAPEVTVEDPPPTEDQ